MTPRERAEALGWKRWEDSRDRWTAWWVIPQSPSREYSAVQRMAHGWGVWFRRSHVVRHPTEDEALAAALELRDVVLS